MVTLEDSPAIQTRHTARRALDAGTYPTAAVLNRQSNPDAWRRELLTHLLLATVVYGAAHLVATPQSWLGAIPAVTHQHISRGLFLLGVLVLSRIVRLAEEPLRCHPAATDAALGGTSLVLTMALALSPLTWWVFQLGQ